MKFFTKVLLNNKRLTSQANSNKRFIFLLTYMFIVMAFSLTKASHMTKADVNGAEQYDFTKEKGRQYL